MSQIETPTPALFRTSLRDWQASWKARQAAQGVDAPPPAPLTTPAGQPRVKKLVAYKARRMRKATGPGR
ncbi:MAG: hypothetical protein U0736_24720 [Gemmataceae bacterium]